MNNAMQQVTQRSVERPYKQYTRCHLLCSKCQRFYHSFQNKEYNHITNTFCARVTYKYGLKCPKWHDKNPFVINKRING